MIPTLIVWGAILGRWWKATLIGSTIAWPTLLVVTGVLRPRPSSLIAAAWLAAVNAAVGVAVHQGALRLVRALRRDRRAARS